MRAKFGVLQQTHGVRLHAKFCLDRFILLPSGGEKPNFLPFFWTSAFSGVANWQQSEKVEHRCTTTNLHYPTVSKSFPYSNAFMAKSGAQSRTFKSVTNRQTDKQTKKTRFWLPRRRVKSKRHQTWHGDRGTRARSCTSKNFGV